VFVDSHCHLEFPDLLREIDSVVERARAAGVTRMVSIGTRISRASEVIGLADRFDGVFATVGLHPEHVGEEGDALTLEALVRATHHPKVVGIGETGLDLHHNPETRASQIAAFRIHIQAARDTGLPLVVHTRDADDDMIAVLREETERGGFTGLIHCFSSGRRLAEVALDIGFMISLSGIITFKSAAALREVVRDLPLDRLLVETDSPYLAPTPHRGKRCEPAYVVRTAEELARVKGLPLAMIAAQTSANFDRLFTKAGSE